MSSPMVVAYALAGSMNLNMIEDPLCTDKEVNPEYLQDIWPSNEQIEAAAAKTITAKMYEDGYADVFEGDDRWKNLPTPKSTKFEWDKDSTYVRNPPYFEGMTRDPSPVSDISSARVLPKLGDTVTT